MIIYCLIAINLVSFAVAGSDKLASKRRHRRVPERSFLLLSLLLGGAGVLLGFYIFRHKTRHHALLVKTWLITLLSYGMALGIYIFAIAF